MKKLLTILFILLAMAIVLVPFADYAFAETILNGVTLSGVTFN